MAIRFVPTNPDDGDDFRVWFTTRRIYTITLLFGIISAIGGYQLLGNPQEAVQNNAMMYFVLSFAAILFAPLRQLRIVKVDESAFWDRVVFYAMEGFVHGFALIQLVLVVFFGFQPRFFP